MSTGSIIDDLCQSIDIAINDALAETERTGRVAMRIIQDGPVAIDFDDSLPPDIQPGTRLARQLGEMVANAQAMMSPSCAKKKPKPRPRPKPGGGY